MSAKKLGSAPIDMNDCREKGYWDVHSKKKVFFDINPLISLFLSIDIYTSFFIYCNLCLPQHFNKFEYIQFVFGLYKKKWVMKIWVTF